VPVDPAHARKLLHNLVAWARTHGVAPHRDYAKIEPIFGTVDAASCDAEFSFGYVALLDDEPEPAELLTADRREAAD
jgi:hypothetical protein